MEDILSGLDPIVVDIGKKIQNQSYQAAATNAFAAISEINVPLYYVSVTTDNFIDTLRQLDMWCNFIDLVSEHAQKMLQKRQLQRVNRIGKLTVGMLSQKLGETALPVGLELIGWQVQSEVQMLQSFLHIFTK